MADIDTAAIRAVYGAEFADGTVYDLCDEVDALRARLAEAWQCAADEREARKAAAEALCEKPKFLGGIGYTAAAEVRAAARGEAAR